MVGLAWAHAPGLSFPCTRCVQSCSAACVDRAALGSSNDGAVGAGVWNKMEEIVLAFRLRWVLEMVGERGWGAEH